MLFKMCLIKRCCIFCLVICKCHLVICKTHLIICKSHLLICKSTLLICKSTLVICKVLQLYSNIQISSNVCYTNTIYIKYDNNECILQKYK